MKDLVCCGGKSVNEKKKERFTTHRANRTQDVDVSARESNRACNRPRVFVREEPFFEPTLFSLARCVSVCICGVYCKCA